MTPKAPNPWGLTPTEVQVLRAYIKHGSQKHAGRAINRSAKTVEFHLKAAKIKLGAPRALQGPMPYILFDRWEQRQRREAEAQMDAAAWLKLRTPAGAQAPVVIVDADRGYIHPDFDHNLALVKGPDSTNFFTPKEAP